MTDVVMLMISLAAFAVLIAGWMIMPDASEGESVRAASARLSEAI